MSDSLVGKLLVATPDLLDPNFARTVVLIVEHDTVEGVLGLVLNRPSDADIASYLEEWAPIAAQPPVVFVGGPVTPEVALGLVDTPGEPPAEWNAVVGNIGLIDLAQSPATYRGVLRARVFAGYAGWVAGQLEEELALDSWFVVPAEPADIFVDEPEGLWRDVLRRQPGRLSWYANFPLHPSLN